MSRKPLGVILAAAGSSLRFGEEKQTLLLRGLPVFLHSVRTFLALADEMVIAVPSGRIPHYQSLAEHFSINQQQLLWIEGGATRSETVRRSLAALTLRDGMVAVHDAARPLATETLLRSLLDLADEKDGAVPVTPVRDTLLTADEQRCMTGVLDRAHCWCAGTPQVFPLAELRDAYTRLGEENLTDDTQVYRKAGGIVRILPWEENNLKLTYPDDMRFAEEELARRGE